MSDRRLWDRLAALRQEAADRGENTVEVSTDDLGDLLHQADPYASDPEERG